MAQFKAEDIDRISELFYRLLKGEKPGPIELPEDYPDNEISQAVGYINGFLAEYLDSAQKLVQLSGGEVSFEPPKGRTPLVAGLKSLQASLKNLTWVTTQIAEGDFNHRVSFMGEFSKAFNSMTDQLKDSFEQRQNAAESMQTQVEELASNRRAMLNMMEDLAETEERSRLLLESAGEGIFGTDSQGILTFINPSALKMLGYEEKELLGKKVHQLIHHSRADGGKYPVEECPMFAAYAKGTAHRVSDEVLWTKDDQSLEVEYSATPIKKDDQVLGSVISFTDISERKRMEAETARLLAETSRRNSELTIINQVGEVLTGELDLDKMVEFTGRTLTEFMKPHSLYIGLLDEEDKLIRLPYYRVGEKMIDYEPVPLGLGLVSLIIKSGESLVLGTFEEQLEMGTLFSTGDCQSYLGVPILARQKAIGVLSIQHPEPEHFTDEDVRLASTVAANLGMAIEKAQLHLETLAAQEEAEAATQAKSEFLANMSHEGSVRNFV